MDRHRSCRHRCLTSWDKSTVRRLGEPARLTSRVPLLLRAPGRPLGAVLLPAPIAGYLAADHQHWTTIITFLLVALLQNSQERSDEALQQKLNAVAVAVAVADGSRTSCGSSRGTTLRCCRTGTSYCTRSGWRTGRAHKIVRQ
jgi:low affinity iron permease